MSKLLAPDSSDPTDSTDSDPWLGTDKLYHLVACFLITAAAYSSLLLLRRLSGCRRRWPCSHCSSSRALLLLAIGSGTAAGVAKEAGDAIGLWPFCPCLASIRDLVADAAGVVLAAIFLVCWQRVAAGVSDADQVPRMP